MKWTFVRTTLATILGATFLILVPAARSQDGGGCSNSNVAGKWGFTTNGTVVGIGPRVSLGIFTLDAEGKLLDGKATASLNGTVTDEVFSGTYSASPDCTGKLTIDVLDPSGNKLFTGTLDLVFDEDAHEMRAMYTSAVTPAGIALTPVIAVEAKRIGEPKQQHVLADDSIRTGEMINPSLAKGAPSAQLPEAAGTVTPPTVQLSRPSILFIAPNPQSIYPPKCNITNANPQSVALTNLGPGVLQITGITISGPFSQTNTCGTNLGAGQSCNISVTWKKTFAYPGEYSVSIQADGTGSPQHVALAGLLGCPF